MKIKARGKGGKEFEEAKVVKENLDGTFHIIFVDDGREEVKVPGRYIKRVDHEGNRRRLNLKKAPTLRVGMAVEARYRGRNRYYPGRIEEDHEDGQFDIRYDDGEFERRVDADSPRRRRFAC